MRLVCVSISLSQFSLSLAVPGLILAVVGKYIPTAVLLYVLGNILCSCMCVYNVSMSQHLSSIYQHMFIYTHTYSDGCVSMAIYSIS